jgi:DNA-binding transcriptional regulator YhcF (GntR family)
METKKVKNKQFIRLVFKLLFTKNVLVELLEKTPKNKKRKVCSQCHELGHGIVSMLCQLNIDKNNKLNNKLKNKIKEHILSQDLLAKKNICEELQELSKELNISFYLCQKLYYEIPSEELLNKTVDIELFLKHMKEKSIQCYECSKFINNETNIIWKNYIWKNNEICDTCWSKYYEEREILWKQVTEYKFTQCNFCSSIKLYKDERYHYDHLNMFDKDKSIWSMVNQGVDIKIIYKEINKCQILCLRCHCIVTELENKLGYTAIKKKLSTKLKQKKISEQEHNEKTITYQRLYEDQMLNIYEKIKMSFKSKN